MGGKLSDRILLSLLLVLLALAIFLALRLVQKRRAAKDRVSYAALFTVAGNARDARLVPSETLARSHCGSCHQLPKPDALPRHIWPAVLQNMAARMGMGHRIGKLAEENVGLLKDLKRNGMLPATPTIGGVDFGRIARYYYSRSPARLASRTRTPRPSTLFSRPRIMESRPGFAEDLTLVAFGPEGLTTGGMASRTGGGEFPLVFYSTRGGLREQHRLQFASPPVQLVRRDGRLLVVTLGGVPGGPARLHQVWRTATGRPASRPLLAFPHRTVHALPLGRGGARFLVSSFGYNAGGMYEYSLEKKKPLRTLLGHAGPLKTALIRTGRKSQPEVVVALTAQARESLYAFDPQSLRPRGRLLQQEPGFGYTDLDAADLDGQPGQEIILTNGDNGDFSGAPTRPHHGVRIYSFSKGLALEQRFFSHIPGAFQTVVADFNGDGRPDLAIAALYAPANSPLRLTLLLNRGGFNFELQSLLLPANFRPGVLAVRPARGRRERTLLAVGDLGQLADPGRSWTQRSAKQRPLLLLYQTRK